VGSITSSTSIREEEVQPKTISTREIKIYYMLRSDKPCMRSDGEGSEAGPVHARNSKSDLNSATQSTQKSGASLLRQARGYRSFAEPARWILDFGCLLPWDIPGWAMGIASWVLSRGRYSIARAYSRELGALARAIQSIRGVGCSREGDTVNTGSEQWMLHVERGLGGVPLEQWMHVKRGLGGTLRGDWKACRCK
jgi:hypothetical protein